MARLASAVLTAGLLLTACSGGEDAPGSVTADEARQLNEAAAMLDANSVDLDAVSTDHDNTDANVAEQQ